MKTNGIKELKKIFEQFNGEDAVINLSHRLYGDQKVRCKLNFFIDDNKVGVRVKNGQELYVYRQNLYVDVIENGILLADDMLRISICVV